MNKDFPWGKGTPCVNVGIGSLLTGFATKKESI